MTTTDPIHILIALRDSPHGLTGPELRSQLQSSPDEGLNTLVETGEIHGQDRAGGEVRWLLTWSGKVRAGEVRS